MKNLRTDYKHYAKQLLSGRYGQAVVLLLVIFVINLIFQSIVDVFDPGFTYSIETGTWIFESGYTYFSTSGFVYIILSFINFVLTALLTYAMVHFFITIVNRGLPNAGESLSAGFTENPVRTILTHILEAIYLIGWFLLLIIPGWIKIYAYGMKVFLLNKEVHLGPNEAITRSRRMMNGYKADMFILDLSFLGWYILSIFTLGILLLYVIPYHYTTRILYMEEIYDSYRKLNDPNYVSKDDTINEEKQEAFDPFESI